MRDISPTGYSPLLAQQVIAPWQISEFYHDGKHATSANITGKNPTHPS